MTTCFKYIKTSTSWFLKTIQRTTLPQTKMYFKCSFDSQINFNKLLEITLLIAILML